MAASALAINPVKAHQNELPAPHVKSTVKVAGKLGASAKTKIGKINHADVQEKVAAANNADSQWESIGTCHYVEDLAASFFYNADPIIYAVEVYEDKANPGMYRIMNPWKHYPYIKECEAEGASFNLSDDSYITINATNPDQVTIPISPLGMSDSDGETYLCSFDAIYDRFTNFPLEETLTYAGKLVDNVITFSIEKSLAILQGDQIYLGNIHGKFELVLPGGESPLDYTLSLEIPEVFCPDTDGDYHVTVTGDSRISGIYYQAITNIDDFLFDDISTINTVGTPVNINEPFVLNVNHVTSNKVYVIFAPVDKNNKVQTAYAIYTTFYNPHFASSEWVTLGEADYTDGLFANLFTTFEPETFKVTVQKHKTTPGLMRLVNPYKNWSHYSEYALDHDHDHFIYLDASDPDFVIMKDGPIGVDITGFGEAAVNSNANVFMEEYGDVLGDQMHILVSAGKLEDGVLTFPYDAYLMMGFSEFNFGNYYYTNLKDNPNFSEEEYNTNPDYEEEPYFDGDFKLDLNTCGVNSITVDPSKGDAEYYNLQGIRVENPSNGLYIRKSGKSVMKVFVK